MTQVASADVVLTIPSEPVSEDEQAAATEPIQADGTAALASNARSWRRDDADEEGGGWNAPVAAESAHAAVSSTAPPPRHAGAVRVLEPGEREYQEWEVRVTKDGNELGVDVLQHEKDNLRVTNIKAGPVLLWNRQNPDQALRPGDRIVSVNGETGDSEQLIGAIRASQELCLGMRRILWLRVELWRDDGGPLGIDVSSNSRSLKILKIRDGPFAAWNSKASMDQRVCENDQIVEVNGFTGEADELLQAIRSSGKQINLLLSVSGRCQGFGIHRSSGGPRPVARPENDRQGAAACEESMTLEEVHDGRNEPPGGHTTLTIT